MFMAYGFLLELQSLSFPIGKWSQKTDTKVYAAHGRWHQYDYEF